MEKLNNKTNKAIFETNAQACDIMNDIIKKDMENKINIAELLKDCPKGTKLYSPLCGECRVLNIYDGLGFDVICGDDTVYNFSYDGRYNIMGDCCIFPSKENRDWNKFQRPFKDGDILFVKSAYNWILVYKESENNEGLYKYVAIQDNPNRTCIFYDNCPLCYKEEVSEIRLATEEEKEKLFQAIKNNGYTWNEETKILEKLIEPEPKFKVGDRIKEKQSGVIGEVIDVQQKKYNVKVDDNKGLYVYFREQDAWELAPNKFDITTLKPFESKVLVRDINTDEWKGHFFSHYDNNSDRPYICIGVEWINEYKQCIPYEGNEHLLGTTNDCDEFYKTW